MTTSLAGLFSDLARTAPAVVPALLLLLKITCILLVARGATLALERASAGVRHLVWLVALGGLLALPFVAAWSPLGIPVLPVEHSTAASFEAAPSTPASQVESVASPGSDVTASPTAPLGEEGTPSHSAVALPGLGTILVALWGLVALALLTRLAFGAWAVRRIVFRAAPLDAPAWQGPLYEIADRMGLEVAPALLRSGDVQMPFAAGLLRPVIVLPAESDAWSAERRTAVLIHELAHIRRRDLAGHAIGRFACALYWFHPLVWSAARRLRAESERACDDLALAYGTRPSEYAEHLLDIVTAVRNTATPAVALAMAHPREFEGRMLAILNPALERRGPTRRESASVVGALAGLALIVGAVAPVPRAADPVPSLPAVAAQDTVPPVPATPRPAPNPVVQPVPAQPPVPPTMRTPVSGATKVLPEAQDDDERATVLARLLKSDSSADVRRVAAWGLQRYAGAEVALEALASAVRNDQDAEVREMAAWAIANAARTPVANGALLHALREDKVPEVRRTAAWAVGSMVNAAAYEVLVGALKDPDAEVRELAAWGIGNASPNKAPAALVVALDDKERDVRLSAAWALFNIADHETVDELDAAFRRETDADVLEGILHALSVMGETAFPTLERLLTSPDPRIRSVAVTALAGGNAMGPWPWPRPQPRPSP